MSIKTEKELAEAIKNNQDEIIIEGDLKNKVIRIKATKNAVWALAIGAIGIAVVSVIAAPVTGGISTTAGFVGAPVAVSILGASTTTTAISIAVAAGGAGSLNKLRKYKIVGKSENKLILKK